MPASTPSSGRYGEQTASFVGGLVQEGAGIIYDWVERYGIDCDLRRGNIYAAYTEKHMDELRAKQALWRRHGMDDHELLDRAAIRQHIGSDVYVGGMIDHSGGHMHPLNLALGEAAALESLGGVIYEHSPVTKVEQDARQGHCHHREAAGSPPRPFWFAAMPISAMSCPN